ncbi:MAG TPA: hypothetical protein VGW12_09745 [Pyrinomonadaceae bacterium]|nr:hypothetical protein [Pyrinomonadaceae bacterium]
MTDTPRFIFRLLLLSLLCLSLWMVTIGVANTQQNEQSIPLKITAQLAPVNNVIPAEIQCGAALVNIAGELNYNCKLKNNSDKNITAAGIISFVVIEKNGMETGNEISTVFAGLDGFDKGIAPGAALSLGPPGPSSYDDSIIKRVEIRIDYVEVENEIVFGRNSKGSQVVKDIREGAARYKNWVKANYEYHRKSVKSIAPLVKDEELLPSDLILLNQSQEIGAKIYRKKLGKKLDAGDDAEVEKLLLSH